MGTQVALLGELKQLFSFEKENGEVKAKLQEDLNDYKLNKISKKCRDIIINMYINCEKDFIQGLKIYQAIIEDLQANKILNKDGVLPNEEAIEIDDEDEKISIDEFNSLSDFDNENNENYSKKNTEYLKNL